MKMVRLVDFLTDAELDAAQRLWQEYRRTPNFSFAAKVTETIIQPNLPRINAALGQENDARYLGYAVEYAFMQITTRRN